MLEFRLLGPVEVWAGDRRIALGPAESAKTRCMLAVLLRTPGALVTTEALIDRVWGEQPPGAAVRYKYIGWLRSALAPSGVSLARRGPGYVLEVAADQVDLHRFRQLVADAQDADKAAAADDAWRLTDEALGLWRGTALSGLSGTWTEMFRDQLERERRAARVLQARCALKLGMTARALGWLDEWEAEYPADEEIIALRLTALHQSGQHAAARACYRRACQRLRDILGVSPGSELVALHQRFQNRNLDTAARAGPIPRQLPSAMPTFAGRGTELASLDRILAGAGQDGPLGVGQDGQARPAAAVILAVSGTAGVGKTALAVNWAHRVAAQFPDGQLYVNLRGFDPSRPTLDQAEAVRGFLDAFGVPVKRIPASLPAQAGLYRSLLAGKRVLVVLDNARDAEQVRPLLPGSPGCLAIVTSRDRLGSLVAAEGAHPLTLDLLSVIEARDLLARRLGADRVASEPDATDDIIARCARLPLALTIAAARAATSPGFSLAAIAAELGEAGNALDRFDGGDRVTDVRTVFSWSCRTLSTGAARLFGLLGLHPGPDISASAAASLAGIARDQARILLAELARAHLLTEHVPGRYACHDLLRAYAAELAYSGEDDNARRAAIDRMHDHYLRTAETAALHLNPTRDPDMTAPSRPGVTREEVSGYQQALAWFTAERPVLLATITQASAGFDPYTWQLASALTTFLDLRGHWQDQMTAQAAALAVARQEGNRAGQAAAHRGLGLACTGLKQFDDARSHYLLALDLFAELGDHTGQAQTHVNLGWVAGGQGRHDEGLHHSRQSLEHYQAAGRRTGQAKALNNIGWHLAEHGDYDQALAHCQQALAIQRELGDRNSQAHTCDSLGYIFHHLGRHQQAIVYYQQALELFRDTGDPYGEATCLRNLGDVHDASGEAGAARRAWMNALNIFRRLGHPDADQVRAKLAGPCSSSRAIHA